MKKFIVVLLLLSLILVPGFNPAQVSAATKASDTANLVGLLPINPILPVFEIPNLVLETNAVSVKAIPVYRLKMTTAGYIRHTYASSVTQRDYLKGFGWLEDGILTYVSPIPLSGKAPLYKCTFANWLAILTTNKADAVSKGFQVQGTVGYVNSPASTVSGTQMVYQNTRTSNTYLHVDYYFTTSPTLVTGYNYISPKFKGWSSAETVQEITVSPIGGSQTGNTDLQINWTSKVSYGAAELLYSTDNGASYTTIINALPNTSTNSYTWKLPNITSSQVRIMVKWSTNSYTPSTAWARTPAFSITKDPGVIQFIPFLPELEFTNFSPANPSNLVIEPGETSAEELTLFWQDNSNTETGFKIERKAEGGAFAQIATVPANTSVYHDLTVAAGTDYTYRVKASGTITDSGYSEEATGTYVDPDAPLFEFMPDFNFDLLFPDPPTSLTAAILPGTVKKVQLAWTKPSGTVTGYMIERKTSGGWGLIGTTVSDISFMDASLDAAVLNASYRVKALNDSFESVPSNEAAVIFPALPVDDAIPGYDGTQSGWAEPEISEAFGWDLTYPQIMNDFQKKITREEFCVISVKLYEKLTGNTALPDTNPFTDTSNSDILKAYGLGIVKGITADRFAPENNISRQEMCVMIYRALQAAGETTALLGNPAFPYSDKGTIASWALNEVKFCNQNSIMLGTSPTTISPLMNTPREQAIVLVKRTYEAFE